MPKINARSELMRKLGAGETPIGTFVTSTDPATTTILGTVGFDFVIIDCEHGPLDKVQALQHVRAAEAAGTIPIARILQNSPFLIQSFLDIGVHGIVVPHVDTADDARAMVKASRYAAGGRGMCPMCHASSYSLEEWPEHVHQSNENVVMIPLLESRLAVQNVSDILAVEGVDMVMFGPGDLSQDMGLDLVRDKALLVEAWTHVRDSAHAVGKRVLVPHGFGFEGGDILVRDMDLMMLRSMAITILRDLRA
jgi:2-keto-3-deoxy-L-rhamnonate aldolase RhmA